MDPVALVITALPALSRTASVPDEVEAVPDKPEFAAYAAASAEHDCSGEDDEGEDNKDATDEDDDSNGIAECGHRDGDHECGVELFIGGIGGAADIANFHWPVSGAMVSEETWLMIPPPEDRTQKDVTVWICPRHSKLYRCCSAYVHGETAFGEGCSWFFLPASDTNTACAGCCAAQKDADSDGESSASGDCESSASGDCERTLKRKREADDEADAADVPAAKKQSDVACSS